jgi:hypothetical protein
MDSWSPRVGGFKREEVEERLVVVHGRASLGIVVRNAEGGERPTTSDGGRHAFHIEGLIVGVWLRPSPS